MCHLAAVVFASQTSSIIKSAEDVHDRPRGSGRISRALSGESAQTHRRSPAQTPPWFHSRQTGNTFHHSLKPGTVCFLDDYWLDGTRRRDACIWCLCVCVSLCVCVCGRCVKIHLSVLMAHKPTRQCLTNIIILTVPALPLAPTCCNEPGLNMTPLLKGVVVIVTLFEGYKNVSYNVLLALFHPEYNTYYSFFQLFTHIFKTLSFFLLLYTQIQELHTHTMQKASNILQNEAQHSKYHKHISKANISKHL